jgi:hypothetical protein
VLFGLLLELGSKKAIVTVLLAVKCWPVTVTALTPEMTPEFGEAVSVAGGGVGVGLGAGLGLGFAWGVGLGYEVLPDVGVGLVVGLADGLGEAPVLGDPVGVGDVMIAANETT